MEETTSTMAPSAPSATTAASAAASTKKKSAAQLRRLQKRAEQRGETYEAPPAVVVVVPPVASVAVDDEAAAVTAQAERKETLKKIAAAKHFLQELHRITEGDGADLKAKERRSMKRKAEAIALEDSGMASVPELLEWYEGHKTEAAEEEDDKDDNTNTKTKNTSDKDEKKHRDPLIAFVGQLSYETTKEELLDHICTNLKDEVAVNTKELKKMLQIRLLTDPKNKQKSRGMGFVEVRIENGGTPEILYSLLKLHQTYLNGRRINIERSAGGGRGNKDSGTSKRKLKLEQYKKEQVTYFADVVEKILQEYQTNGELRAEDFAQFDAGVLTVLKRHAGPVVRAAMAEYIEKGGRDMNNPSAYLTFLVTKIAKEGIHEMEIDKPKKRNYSTSANNKHNNNSSSSNNTDYKRTKTTAAAGSEFDKAGIDMSLSSRKNISNDLSKIFPSSQRGGRGRGYMNNVRTRRWLKKRYSTSKTNE